MQMAVGTSLLVVMMKSTAGFLGYTVVIGGESVLRWNPAVELAWGTVTVLTGMAVMGSLAGAALSPSIHPERLRRAFGWFVLGMAFLVLGLQVGGSVLEFARGSAVQALEVAAGAAVLVMGIIVLVRWPVRVAVGDFDTTGAAVAAQEPASPAPHARSTDPATRSDLAAE